MKTNTIKLIYTALFATLIYLATSFLKFEIAPKTMVHLGNAIVVVAFLTLRFKHALLATVIGFSLFDILNGYITSLHFTILESLIVLIVIHFIFKFFNEKDHFFAITTISFTAAIVKITVIFIRRLITYIIISNDIVLALPVTVSKMPNSIITGVFTLIATPIIYYNLKPILNKISLHFKQ